MKKQLLFHFIGLSATLATCLLLRLVFSLFIIVIITSRAGMEKGQQATRFIFDEWLTRGDPEAGALILYALALAFFKLLRSPRRFKANHYTWLSTSPWILGKPIPAGEYRIGIADLAALLAIEVLLSFYVDWPTGLTIYGFALFYFAGLFLVSFPDTAWREGYGTGLLLALPLMFTDYFVWLVSGVFTLCLILSLSAQKSSWKHWVGLNQDALSENICDSAKPQVGWPWCSVIESQDLKGGKHAFILSALCAIWIYAIGHHHLIAEEFGLLNGWYFIVFAIAFTRWVVFASVGKAPLSIWGRITTRRFILSGYDRIHVVPICSIFSGLAVFIATITINATYAVAESLAIGTTIYVCLRMGPSLKEWIYTAEYQAHPPNKKMESCKSI